MQAEILFFPNDLNAGCAALIENGFEVEVLDWVDDHGPAIWVMARIITELDEIPFFSWVQGIVEPLQGDLVEAGFSFQDAPIRRVGEA